MRIRWLDDAISDLVEIRKYIAADKPQTANRIANLIRQSVEPLIVQPDIGRPGRIEGTRELVLTSLPYIIPYRVRNDSIEILRVLHAARKWPHELD
ncbi:MAG TPA: type II toxin-antitoxin system RelE/ParE family toxin [Dissulfurispiraceae bacterium]|nr:type II toxin-antitoxin system RelE/ParE family toxin [Dissulfurispiraceae bacterium]